MMHFKKNYLLIFILFISSQTLAQLSTDYKASEAEDWDKLFIRNSGWFGGDGIFAIPLDGREFVPADKNTETLIIFSDTMVGRHTGDTLMKGDFSMVNNSVALLKGSKPASKNIEFKWGNNSIDEPTTIFTPSTPNAKPDEYYWLGDGFVNVEADSTLYIFAYRIVNTHSGDFPFKQVGISLIAIAPGSQPPYTDHQQIETPFSDDSQGSYGSGIYVNTESAGAPNPDGYIYIYGVKGVDKELLVARVLPKEFTTFNNWTFWTGEKWVSDLTKATPIAKHVSNELSLSPLPNGKLLLTYQYKGIYPEVAIQVGESLVGPFEPIKKIWYTEEEKEDKDFFTYNAKAHPHLSPKGAVLISYNVNSFDFWNDILQKPTLYRPRFILLKLN